MATLGPRTARGIPRQPLLLTEDQVAALLNLDIPTLQKSYLWKIGKERHPYRLSYIRAVPTRPHGPGTHHESIEWRVPDYELDRWLKYHKLYVYDPDAVYENEARMGEGFAPDSIQPHLPSVTSTPPSEEPPDDDLLAL